MVALAPNLNPKLQKDNLLHLPGRYFPAQIPYRGHILTRNVKFAMLWVSELLQVTPLKYYDTVLTVQTNQDCVLESLKKVS